MNPDAPSRRPVLSARHSQPWAWIRQWAVIAAVAMLSPLQAQPVSELQPGEYASAEGAGLLTLQKSSGQGMPFAIDIQGANGHSCHLEGNVRAGRSELAVDGLPACMLSFMAQGRNGGVKVAAKQGEACRGYCGARTDFEGLYQRVPAGCRAEQREQVRKDFKLQYDDRRFTDAGRTLAPLLSRCGAVLNGAEAAAVRNDLAITQYHLGRHADCLATLQPLAADAARTDDALREALPPIDAEVMMPLIQAARSNLALCRKLATP